MSAYPAFPLATGTVGTGATSVMGRGLVFNVGGAKTLAQLVGMPIHYRGGIRIENNDGIDGPLTIYNMPDGVLMTAEGVNCNSTDDIEIGMATQDGQDTYIIDTVTFWGATATPGVLRGSVSSLKNRAGVVLVPTSTIFTSMTADDVVFDVAVPVKRAARYASLFWKPSVIQDIKVNIAVYRRLLRPSEVF